MCKPSRVEFICHLRSSVEYSVLISSDRLDRTPFRPDR